MSALRPVDMRTPLAAILLALAACAYPLHGQRTPTVTSVRGLAFGTLLPGVPLVVPPADAARSAQFDIRVNNRGLALITFILPPVMTGPAATMPLSFGATSAGFSDTGSTAGMTLFDPRAPFTGTASTNGRATIFLGGTALPAGTQRAGSYTGTVTLTVANVSI
jgi:hypothetical protein